MLAGSPPSGPRTVRTPTRSPHVCSWSAAAARNVSAAPTTTCLSSATSTRASLPTVVVFPVPFTPTTSTTAGCAPLRLTLSVRSSDGLTSAISSSRRISRACSLPTPSTRTRVRSRSTSSCVGATPTSAVMRVVSMSSHASSSSLSRESSASSPLPSEPCDRARRARSRTSRPCADSGFSIVGVGPGSGSSVSSSVRVGVSRGSSASSPTFGSAVSSGAGWVADGSWDLRRRVTTSTAVPATRTTATTMMAISAWSASRLTS